MKTNLSRRRFLQTSGAMSAASVMGGSLFANLAAMADASAAVGDYRALVCIFLYGGNDGFNMVLPLDTTSWNEYALKRQKPVNSTSASDVSIVLDQASLPRITAKDPDTGAAVQYGLHPKLTRIANLYNQKSLAVLANVGTLEAFTTRNEYYNRLKWPPGLYSHVDQQILWQSGVSNTDPGGWGGRMVETLIDSPVNPLTKTGFESINTGDNTAFVYGNTLSPYNLAPSKSGAVRISDSIGDLPFGTIDRSHLLNLVSGRATGMAPTHLMEKDWSGALQRAIDNEAYLTNNLTNVTLSTTATKPAILGTELENVARMIKLQANNGTRGRQVFFLGFGGFDNHDNQIRDQANLLEQLDLMLDYFYNALKDDGLLNVVTTFTASEFGRRLASNGDGTDHGWGSHHFIMGGAVNGGAVYGRMPSYAKATDGSFSDVNMVEADGVMMPYASTDQYAATLGKWFAGLNDAQLKAILPKLFGGPNREGKSGGSIDLGFMKA